MMMMMMTTMTMMMNNDGDGDDDDDDDRFSRNLSLILFSSIFNGMMMITMKVAVKTIF